MDRKTIGLFDASPRGLSIDIDTIDTKNDIKCTELKIDEPVKNLTRGTISPSIIDLTLSLDEAVFKIQPNTDTNMASLKPYYFVFTFDSAGEVLSETCANKLNFLLTYLEHYNMMKKRNKKNVLNYV